jgi:hypothetical protein
MLILMNLNDLCLLPAQCCYIIGYIRKVESLSFIYSLYNVGDRTEPYGTPACISLGVDILPSTETLNFLCERKELLSLNGLLENLIQIIHIANQGAMLYQRLF